MLRVDVERIRRAAIEIFLAPTCEFIFLRIYSRDISAVVTNTSLYSGKFGKFWQFVRKRERFPKQEPLSFKPQRNSPKIDEEHREDATI